MSSATSSLTANLSYPLSVADALRTTRERLYSTCFDRIDQENVTPQQREEEYENWMGHMDEYLMYASNPVLPLYECNLVLLENEVLVGWNTRMTQHFMVDMSERDEKAMETFERKIKELPAILRGRTDSSVKDPQASNVPPRLKPLAQYPVRGAQKGSDSKPINLPDPFHKPDHHAALKAHLNSDCHSLPKTSSVPVLKLLTTIIYPKIPQGFRMSWKTTPHGDYALTKLGTRILQIHRSYSKPNNRAFEVQWHESLRVYVNPCSNCAGKNWCLLQPDCMKGPCLICKRQKSGCKPASSKNGPRQTECLSILEPKEQTADTFHSSGTAEKMDLDPGPSEYPKFRYWKMNDERSCAGAMGSPREKLDVPKLERKFTC